MTTAGAEGAPAEETLVTTAGASALRGLDALVPATLERFRAPGVALAAITPAGTIFRGWGVADVDETRPVTADTAFAIGSCSKLFTATLAVALGHAGLLDLDDPVTRHLPGVQLYDPWVTREVTLRDLLANRVGLSRETMYEYGSGLTLGEILAGTAAVPPIRGFRTGYAYSNVGYVIASQVLASAGRATFPELLRRFVTQPAGMRSIAADFESTLALPDLATPHLVRVTGPARPIARLDRDNGMGSGTIHASARDLATWLRLHLGLGGDDVVAPRATLSALYEPNTLGSPSDVSFEGLPAPMFEAYALGLHVREHLGHVVHLHEGSLNGFQALVGLVRSAGVGIAMSVNAADSLAARTIGWSFLSAALGGTGHDWAGIVERTHARDRRRDLDEAARKWPDPRQPRGGPGGHEAAQSGTFTSPRYGTVEIQRDAGRLVLRPREYIRFSADLEPRDTTRYDVRLHDPVAAAELDGYPLWLRFEAGEHGPRAVEIAPLDRFERAGPEARR